MKEFLKIAFLAILAIAVIATCVCAFNSKEGFYIVCGIITLAANGYAIYKYGRRIENM